MNVFHIKTKQFSGTDYHEVYHHAVTYYRTLTAHSRRRPYIRSIFFKKQKIFLELFWRHIFDKNIRDRARRLKYLACAIELLQNSRLPPTSKINPNDRSEILHRFLGSVGDGTTIAIHIRQEKRTGALWLMSVFPYENEKISRSRGGI